MNSQRWGRARVKHSLWYCVGDVTLELLGLWSISSLTRMFPQQEGTLLWQIKITQLPPAVFLESQSNDTSFIPKPPSSLTDMHTNYSALKCGSVCNLMLLKTVTRFVSLFHQLFCHVAKLSYVPSFIMSSSALRNFNYIALNRCNRRSVILFLLLNSPGQVKFSICNSNWPQCKRRQREGGEKVLIQYLY